MEFTFVAQPLGHPERSFKGSDPSAQFLAKTSHLLYPALLIIPLQCQAHGSVRYLVQIVSDRYRVP